MRDWSKHYPLTVDEYHVRAAIDWRVVLTALGGFPSDGSSEWATESEGLDFLDLPE